ncbi:MAG: AAA family ATPase [Thermoplasmata archaeon]|nr:AAA family ATPase [Thermoplasmata archaeon]
MAVSASTERGKAVPLFGRHEVVEELLRLLQGSREGGGRLLLLVGEGGIGKSTLLGAAEASARGLDYQVLVGRALPSDVPEPFALVQDLLRSARQRHDPPTVRSRASPVLPMFLGPFETDATGPAARSTGLTEEPPDQEEAARLLRHLANPVERVDANRSNLFEELADYLLQLSKERPLLLAIDDLQFADDSSLELLLRLLPRIERSPLVIVATVPPLSEMPSRSAGIIATLLSSPRSAPLKLRAMSESELEPYVKWLLNGRDPGRDSVMRWFTQTDGNPLFVEYLVRGSSGFAPPPAGPERRGQDLDGLLRDRVKRLADVDRRVLVYGAILGKEFEFPMLSLASGQDEERLSESLDRLVHGGLLREKGGEVYEFVREAVRADVYSQLTETRRRILHRKAADAIASRPGGSSATRDYELARQYYLGQNDPKAVEYNRRAAEHAARALAFETAVLHLERALDSQRRLTPRDLAGELRLMIELGRILDEFGDLRRSEGVLLDAVTRARSEAGRETELALALIGLAQTRTDLSEYSSARELATEAYGILEKLGNPRGIMTAHRVLGVAYWRLGDLPLAVSHQTEALAIAEKSGTANEKGHALIDLANTEIRLGGERIAEALTLYERAIALFAESRDHSAQSRVLMNRALLHHNAGHMDLALVDMEGAIAAAEKSRSRIWIGYCHLNMAQFRVELHAPAEARTHAERARAMLEPLGDQLALQQLLMIDAMIAAEERRFEAAEQLYQRSLKLAQVLSLSAETAEVEYRLAELSAEAGELDKAREHLSQARGLGILRLRGDLSENVAALAKRLATSPTAQR